MNHNGVQSFPTDGSSAFVAGQVVELNVSGQAIPGAANTKTVGVVLQDVLATASDRPVDVQLFSAGGTALVKAGGAITVGAIVACKTSVFKVASATNAEPHGIALEKASTGGLFRVLIRG